jgi:hypothetical protein
VKSKRLWSFLKVRIFMTLAAKRNRLPAPGAAGYSGTGDDAMQLASCKVSSLNPQTASTHGVPIALAHEVARRILLLRAETGIDLICPTRKDKKFD